MLAIDPSILNFQCLPLSFQEACRGLCRILAFIVRDDLRSQRPPCFKHFPSNFEFASDFGFRISDFFGLRISRLHLGPSAALTVEPAPPLAPPPTIEMIACAGLSLFAPRP